MDTADYSDKTTPVAVTLNGAADATVTVGGVAEDTIRNIENVIGGSGSNILIGDGLANVLSGGGLFDFLRGGGGNDTLDGSGGVDTADFSDKTASVVVTLNGSTDAIVTVGGVAEDTIRNIESVWGGSGADTLTGDGSDNLLSGLGGADTLDGGGGADTADYSFLGFSGSASVSVTLNGATDAVVTVDGVAEDTIRNIENVKGGAGADTLTGDSSANVFFGGGGNDTLDGRTGVDVADFSDKTASVVVALNGATAAVVTVGGAVEDTVRNIENVAGGSGADRLTGDGLANLLSGGLGNDVLRGGAGSDTLDGGGGSDTADYSEKTASVAVTLNGATNAVVKVGGVNEDTIRNIEKVLGGSGADTLIGDALANAFGGAAGDDLLRGGLGADTLDGGAGSDTADYSDKSASVVVTLNGATNAIVKVGGVNEDTIRNIENVRGGSGADTLTGDGLANVLRGGAGADVLDGGGGSDTADYGDKSASVAVTLNGATNAVVKVGGVNEDTIRNIEKVLGGSGADTLIGDGLANVFGGGAGNDLLRGRGGADFLDGGAGVDFADYRDKTSSVAVTLNGSTNAAVTVGGAAEDTIRNIENVLGGSGADTLTGDGLSNVLRGGLGSDVLDGNGGADTADYGDKTASVVVTLNGSTNATVTVGGAAEDTIRNIENIRGGSGADTLTGDGLANVFAGGGGADKFVFKPSFGKDAITDFSASDKLAIDDTIFADWASVLGASQQVGSDTLITASAADTITLKNFAVGNLTQSQVQFI